MAQTLSDVTLLEDIAQGSSTSGDNPYNETEDNPSGLEPVILYIKTEVSLPASPTVDGTGYYMADAYSTGVDITDVDHITNAVPKHTNVLVFVPDIAGTGIRGAVAKESLVLGFPMYQSLTVAVIKELGMSTSVIDDTRVLPVLVYYVVQTLPLIARLTVDNGDGTYDAIEQYWSSGAWTDRPHGMQFTTDPTDDHPPALMEFNQRTGLTVGTDGEVVEAMPIPIDFSASINAGYIFRAPSAGTGGIPAKITGYSSGRYSVDLYENGTGSASTGSGTALPLNLGIEETVPTDTWVIVQAGAVNVVEG